MKPCFRCFLLVAVIFCFALTLPAQQTGSIQISGDVAKPMILTAADLAAMPRVTVNIGDTKYEGILLDDILKRAGVPSGSTLRGKALTTTVVAQAKDGYQVAFSLGELDPSVTDNQIVLADSSGGKPLQADEGPFRIVIPKDKIGARSVRMLTGLAVMQSNR